MIGQNLKVSGYRIKSAATRREFKAILLEVVDLIGMTPAGRPKVWSFPWYSRFWRRLLALLIRFLIGRTIPGLGGAGWTICQPLVESFAVLDFWREHGHYFLVIGSCNDYEPCQVARYLSDNYGPTTYQEGFTL